MDDLVSRQAVKDGMHKYGFHAPDMTVNEFVEDCLPATNIKPVVRGKWIEMGQNKDETHNICCSACGKGIKSKGHANSYYTKHKYLYCLHCGADMREIK